MAVCAQFGWRLSARMLGRALIGVAALGVSWAGAARDADARSLQSVCNVREVDALLARAGETPRTQQIDKSKFYEAAKANFSIYNESGNHYPGTDALIDYWNERPHLKDLRWLAYVLGTSYHETARRMYPVRETLASTDAAVVSILSRHSATRNKTYWRRDSETGQNYYGRGYVQLTWRSNYAFADKRLNREQLPRDQQFLWVADLALDPEDAVEILFDGMIYGWYTGKHCLPFYFDPEGRHRADWKNARRIVNVLDRWESIANHSMRFLAALEASQVAVGAASTIEPEPAPDPAPTPELVAELREQIDRLARSNEGLRLQIQRMDARFDAAEAERLAQIQSQQERIAALEAELAEGRSDPRVEALAERNAALEQLNAQLTTEVGRLQDRETELEALLSRRATAITTLEEEIAEQQRRNSEAQRGLNATVETLQADVVARDAQLEALGASNRDLNRTIATLQADIVSRDARLEAFGASNDELNRSIAALQSDLRTAQAQIEELRVEADKGFFQWLFD